MIRFGRTLSPGHPDRACDIIAESVVDEYLRRDPESSCRIHVSGGKGALFVTGVVSSKADFDVGAIVSQTVAGLGVRSHVESFVSIESVPGLFVLDAMRTAYPISILGYATRETDERLPKPVVLSRYIAKALEDKRQNDEDWFWLEPSFDVTVIESDGSSRAMMNLAHGELDVVEIRSRVIDFVKSMGIVDLVSMNDNGPLRANGLEIDIGSSGSVDQPYGSTIVLPVSVIGLDPSNSQKFGTWLARGLACRALERSDAKAVMVQAVYSPNGRLPMELRVRDERGRDLFLEGDAEMMTAEYLAKILRPGMSADVAHWGFAGEAKFLWESHSKKA